MSMVAACLQKGLPAWRLSAILHVHCANSKFVEAAVQNGAPTHDLLTLGERQQLGDDGVRMEHPAVTVHKLHAARGDEIELGQRPSYHAGDGFRVAIADDPAGSLS